MKFEKHLLLAGEQTFRTITLLIWTGLSIGIGTGLLLGLQPSYFQGVIPRALIPTSIWIALTLTTHHIYPEAHQ